jgi:hypothetical protein
MTLDNMIGIMPLADPCGARKKLSEADKRFVSEGVVEITALLKWLKDREAIIAKRFGNDVPWQAKK